MDTKEIQYNAVEKIIETNEVIFFILGKSCFGFITTNNFIEGNYELLKTKMLAESIPYLIK